MPALPSASVIQENVSQALSEDVGSGDITAQLVAVDSQSKANIISRQSGILCGTAWFDEVFNQLEGNVQISWQASDGDKIIPAQVICELQGPSRTLLTGERAALNFLQTLSATASRAHHYMELVKHTSVILLDTRKTIPGLRQAQKYAVACGGCTNHRMGLYDAFLIKENHIQACGSVTAAIQQARQLDNNKPVEVEVENLQQLEEALSAGADTVLLDNFQPDEIIEAVAITRGRARLEVSGGIDEQNIKQLAETGVDYLSIGDLTKNISAIDLSMRFE